MGEDGAEYRMGEVEVEPASFSDIFEAGLRLRKKGENFVLPHFPTHLSS